MDPAAAGGAALFLDFDGTLVDIAEHPDAVMVDPGLPEVLTGLRERLGGALAIVTGRPISDIDRYLPGLGVDVCGLHGLERRVAGIVSVPDGLRDLGPEVEALRQALAGHSGILIENKGISVAVHWRMAPEAEAEARAAIDDLARRLGPTYRVQEGKAVRELVPAAAGKGEAIRALMRMPPYSGRRPIFIGDDVTDEHGFEAVRDLGGATVKVGGGETGAERRVPSPAELRTVLSDWLRTEPKPENLQGA
jgi:trehalose 6-phosphate phosphatase